MKEMLIELSGWVPAIVFPLATAVQLYAILKRKTAEGVSIFTWTMFGFAGIGLYIYTEKYYSLQAILGFLVTAVLDFIIMGVCLSLRAKKA